MKHFATAAFVIALATAPVCSIAQEDGDGGVEEGFSLIEEGAKLLLRGLSDEIEPMMKDLAIEMEPKLRAFAEDLLPMLEEFESLIGDLNQYHPPEKLPNGDIILRRKIPLENGPQDEAEGGEVDI
ncbi:hypothetical protein CLV78_102221 [Aliiruegeria haliotis]|uniref:AAA+ family ATPase n=1 Tax=Aliiruegeria haliotis TaxID=1280846 RepID=A0A2T0RV62_9RHOB|nr:hypothetical protein [Aliiruegeria haliotis]PRY25044.1 hypothetical protein CLV78_102221 [Aliiruegeria haliotis]